MKKLCGLDQYTQERKIYKKLFAVKFLNVNMLTTILLITIIALIVGNIILIKEGIFKKTDIKQYLQSNNHFVNKNLQLNQFYYLDKKTDIINKKVEGIKHTLLNLNGHKNNGINYDIYKKIEELERFKRNAEIELEGLKTILMDNERRKGEKEYKKLNEKIHMLAYNVK